MVGGRCDDDGERSSAVKKRKAPLLTVDTGTGILDETEGE
jgi:hypothetical protein